MFLIWGYYATNYTMGYSVIFSGKIQSNQMIPIWEIEIWKKISSKNLELFFLTYITCMVFFIVKSSIRIYKIWKDGKLNSSLDTFFA